MDFPTSWTPSALWLKLTDAVVPESQAESLVNQIYGIGGTAQTGQPDPEISNSKDLSLPAVYVRAKDAVSQGVSNITSQIQSGFIRYTVIALVVVIVAGILFGYLPALGKKFAR